VKLNDRQIELYSRQIILRELGGLGQRKLLESRCLAVGGGPALETAVSYLTGAGVGALDLWPATDPHRAVTAGDEAQRLDLIRSAERAPETAVRVVSPREDVDLDRYDVVLVASVRAVGSPSSAILPASATGQARQGTIGILLDPGRWLGLLLTPTVSASCPSCTRLDDAAPARDPVPEPTEDALALPLTGAMAALAAVLWLAGIAQEIEPRGLRLAADAATWVDAGIVRDLPCKRGCRPRT